MHADNRVRGPGGGGEGVRGGAGLSCSAMACSNSGKRGMLITTGREGVEGGGWSGGLFQAMAKNSPYKTLRKLTHSSCVKNGAQNE